MMVALVLIFVGLFILGAPIAVALGATSLFNTQVFETISLSAFTKVATNGFNSYLLVACPLFTFAGDIMAKGGISRRLINVAKLGFGNITGGLGHCHHHCLHDLCRHFRYRLRDGFRHRPDYDSGNGKGTL